jgi:hypothetical protein
MRRSFVPFLAVLVALGFSGCDRPQNTIDQTRKDISAYKASPTDAGQAKVEADLAALDKQIAQLESKGKTDEAAGYRATEENLRSDYRAARMMRAMKDAQSALQGMGQTLKEAGQSIGDAFREANSSPTPTAPAGK